MAIAIPMSHRGYERPEGHQPGDPDIFVHPKIIEAFSSLEVDYESQRNLYEYELPYWIPGDPEPPIRTFIDMESPVHGTPAFTPEPRRQLSFDSSRRGNSIGINLRTFGHEGEETVTAASTKRISREIILQSIGRRLIAHNSLRLSLDDFDEALRWPGIFSAAGGLLTYGFGGNALATAGAAVVVAAVALPLNISELRDKRHDHIKDQALPMLERILPGHVADFSFPDAPL